MDKNYEQVIQEMNTLLMLKEHFKFMGIVYTGIHRTTYILDKNKKVHHIIYPVVSAVHHQQIIDLIAD